MGNPSPSLVKEFRYYRKSAIYYYNGKKIKGWFYSKLSNYYSKKHEKEIMSR